MLWPSPLPAPYRTVLYLVNRFCEEHYEEAPHASSPKRSEKQVLSASHKKKSVHRGGKHHEHAKKATNADVATLTATQSLGTEKGRLNPFFVWLFVLY